MLAKTSIDYHKVVGQFQLPAFNHSKQQASFEYVKVADFPELNFNPVLGSIYPHLVFVNSIGDCGYRYALVKKTVCTIVTGNDENEYATEKWHIKHNWLRAQ